MFNFYARFKFWFNYENFGQKFKFLGVNSNFSGQILRQNCHNSKFSYDLKIDFYSEFQILGEIFLKTEFTSTTFGNTSTELNLHQPQLLYR